MALINNSIIAIAIFGLTILFLQPAHAQVRGEILWHVGNELESEPVPLYEGIGTVFSIRLPPVEEVEDEEDAIVSAEENVLMMEELRAQQLVRSAASKMSRIRDLLKDEEAFIPDVSSIKISAITSGKAGPMVLINRRWFMEGDTLEAPVVTAETLVGLLSDLEMIDNNLADIVREEVESRLSSIGPRRVMIRKINNDGINLRMPSGRLGVISFVNKGW